MIIAVICLGIIVGFIALFLCDATVYEIEYMGITYHFLSKKRAEKQYEYLCFLAELDKELIQQRKEIKALRAEIEASTNEAR